jgi:hypothetical protein
MFNSPVFAKENKAIVEELLGDDALDNPDSAEAAAKQAAEAKEAEARRAEEEAREIEARRAALEAEGARRLTLPQVRKGHFKLHLLANDYLRLQKRAHFLRLFTRVYVSQHQVQQVSAELAPLLAPRATLLVETAKYVPVKDAQRVVFLQKVHEVFV